MIATSSERLELSPSDEMVVGLGTLPNGEECAVVDFIDGESGRPVRLWFRAATFVGFADHFHSVANELVNHLGQIKE